MKLLCYFLLVASRVFVIKALENKEKFSVAFEWNYLNFTWESSEQNSFKSYVPGEDLLAGIKIHKDVVYVTLPRIHESARVTLASISLNAEKKNPLLAPYPSWEMNMGESCESLQNVLGMEIDKGGIMWVLDARRVGNTTKCPPKILLLDLNRNGTVLQSFTVPDKLCPHTKGCFLNDIVIDKDFAYISDATNVDPGILVYNRKLNQAWKMRDKSMYGDLEATLIVAQGIESTSLNHINGVALSPDCGENRTFYYMSLNSFNIFSINTAILKNPRFADQTVTKYVTNHGRKKTQSGGMMCDENGNIYYGLLPLDVIEKWDTRKPLEDASIVEQNSEIITWADGFAIDLNCDLYITINSILHFFRKDLNLQNINFRIIKSHVGARNYFYCGKSVL